MCKDDATEWVNSHMTQPIEECREPSLINTSQTRERGSDMTKYQREKKEGRIIQVSRCVLGADWLEWNNEITFDCARWYHTHSVKIDEIEMIWSQSVKLKIMKKHTIDTSLIKVQTGELSIVWWRSSQWSVVHNYKDLFSHQFSPMNDRRNTSSCTQTKTSHQLENRLLLFEFP